mgnify:CR=1 FL=1
MGLKQLKEQNAADKNHYRMKEVWKTEEVMENLPYQLTGAQKNVWYEIEQDLRGEKLMTVWYRETWAAVRLSWHSLR